MCPGWWMYTGMCLNCSHFRCVTDCHSSAWNLFPLTCHSSSFGNVCSTLWLLRSGIAATRDLNTLGFNLTLIAFISMTQFHAALWSTHWNLFVCETEFSQFLIFSVFFYYFLEQSVVLFFHVFLKGYQQKEILAFYGSQDVNCHHPYINTFKQLL